MIGITEIAASFNLALKSEIKTPPYKNETGSSEGTGRKTYNVSTYKRSAEKSKFKS